MPDALRLAEIMAHRPDGGWSAAVRPQRTPGLALVTVNVPLGDLSGDELRVLADLAALGDGHLYTTRNQNVQYRDVPVARVGELGEALGAVGLGLAGADSSVDVRACTGSAVCALAITAAPSAGARIAASPLLARNGSLRVHVSGCPNSCAQHQAADIGLSGGKVRINGATRLGYTLSVGADVPTRRLAQPIGRVADDDVEAAVTGVIGTWEALRHPGERLVDTLDRAGAAMFASHVATIASGFEVGPAPAIRGDRRRAVAGHRLTRRDGTPGHASGPGVSSQRPAGRSGRHSTSGRTEVQPRRWTVCTVTPTGWSTRRSRRAAGSMADSPHCWPQMRCRSTAGHDGAGSFGEGGEQQALEVGQDHVVVAGRTDAPWTTTSLPAMRRWRWRSWRRSTGTHQQAEAAAGTQRRSNPTAAAISAVTGPMHAATAIDGASRRSGPTAISSAKPAKLHTGGAGEGHGVELPGQQVLTRRRAGPRSSAPVHR